MASERTDELYEVLLSRGYPKEFCAEIAYKNMNTDYTATRMLGYLYRVSNPRIEDLVDEMLTYDKTNEAARKTIIKNSGVLENEVPDDVGLSESGIIQRYWIEL